MKWLLLAFIFINIVSSCNSKSSHYWLIQDGRTFQVNSMEYFASDTMIRQKINYDTYSEYFELNLKTMKGKHKGYFHFMEDSTLTIHRINCLECPERLELYRLKKGYDDYTTDNEVDFYLEIGKGVFMVDPRHTNDTRVLISL